MHSSQPSKTESCFLSLLAVSLAATLLAFFYFSTAEWIGHTYSPFVNQIGSAALIVACLAASYRIIQVNTVTVWTPLPWFLIVSAIYYGFGPLAYYYASIESVAFMDSFYPIDDDSLLRTHLLNNVGISITCLSVAVVMSIFPPLKSKRAEYDPILTKRMMWTFLLVGGGIKYIFTLPYYMGWLSWVLPGSVQHLANLITSAIVLLIILIFNGHKKYQWMLYPLIASEVLSGLLTLSKFDVLMTALAATLAIYLYRPRLKVIIWSAVGVALVYALVLSPFVMFARLVIGSNSSRDTQDLEAAISLYRQNDIKDQAILNPEIQYWWTRLSYANVQAFAIQSYDEGVRGQTLWLLPYVFVPRALFTDKPIMTSGKEFTQLLTGEEMNSNTGLGFFGESYWNGGWAVLVLACAYVGVLFAIFARFSMGVILNHQYAYLPIVMIGILTGMRPDDWFVPTVVGGIIEALLLYMILYVLTICLKTLPVTLRPAHH